MIIMLNMNKMDEFISSSLHLKDVNCQSSYQESCS
jgi:hypothetical protein